MILTVNGVRTPGNTPLDRLTRSVVISLFSWRRAEPDDNAEQPMGWWGDTWPTVQNDRIGSRLYLLRRTTLTNKTPLQARTYINQALAWMIEDGVAARIDTQVERTGIDVLATAITLWQRDGARHTITFDDLWSEVNG
ncbi:phage GP46 family protein [Erwinia pyrifoliae]|uniref:phage GP46 family protein n=1 Tax=Erwinia pyrifoliae TaxID=79967 RepID=UPI002200D67A|nr:phage GP46 family protein [Erwinia pyrifoliae]UWS31750.1 phage GP46 family protein [Erwinia pyrifoliae]